MPFQSSKTPKDKNNPKEKRKERRKIRSTFQGILPSTHTKFLYSERASAFASAKGSITVEASAAVPLFFFAVLCLFCLLEMMAIQTSVRSGLQYAGKIAAQNGYSTKMISTSELEADVVRAIGSGRLERSLVKNGSRGIDCQGSKVSPVTGIGELCARYEIMLPVPIFQAGHIMCEEKIPVKLWCGYEKQRFGGKEEEIVYVTETGIVYHRDYNCTYLDLSVRMVPSGQIQSLRNKSGAKYYACSRCKGQGNGVYITETGNRYHSTVTCSSLKRTVYAIEISEAVGRRPCSKCAN